jgi:hypothetical protein
VIKKVKIVSYSYISRQVYGIIHILKYDLYTFYAVDVLSTFTIKNTILGSTYYHFCLKLSHLAFDIKSVDYMVWCYFMLT